MPHAKHAAEQHELAAKHHDQAAEHHREAAGLLADGEHEAGPIMRISPMRIDKHAEHHAGEAAKAHIAVHHTQAAEDEDS